MPRPTRLLATLVAAVAVTSGRAADELTPTFTQTRGPAALLIQGGQVRGEAVEVPLSGILQVMIRVEGPATLEVNAHPFPAAKEWKVRKSLPAAVTALQTGAVRWQQAHEVEPRVPGDLALVAPALAYRTDANAPWQEVAWRPVPTRVTTVVEEVTPAAARDITGIEAIPDEWSWRTPVFWTGAVVLLLGILLAYLEYRRLGARGEDAHSPDQWALRELARAEREALPPAGSSDRFYTQLSDVLRKYLELRFRLPASQQTTAEFLRAMRQEPRLIPDQQEFLRDFLQRCDLAKFAQAEATPAECQATAAQARAFIQQTT